MSDNLAAALDGVRNRAEGARMAFSPPRSVELSQRDVPRLLAAVDAILARHVPKTVKVRHLCASHGITGLKLGGAWTEVDGCPDCVITEHETCAVCEVVCPDDNLWPCEDYLAISRALTREENTDG